MPLSITINIWYVALLLATFLAIAQFGVGDQTFIRKITDDVQETYDETPAQWFRRLSHAQRRFLNLHFYAHDTYTGPNATLYQVAKASITDQSPVRFGEVMVFDSPLLDGPDLTTATEIGRVQGMDTTAAFDEATAVSTTTFLFKNIYIGSTLSILGRVNHDVSVVSEFPVVGGTGVFRGARGTATLTTVPEKPSIRDCNVYFEYYL